MNKITWETGKPTGNKMIFVSYKECRVVGYANTKGGKPALWGYVNCTPKFINAKTVRMNWNKYTELKWTTAEEILTLLDLPTESLISQEENKQILDRELKKHGLYIHPLNACG